MQTADTQTDSQAPALTQRSRPREVLSAPKHERTRAFLGQVL